MCSCSGMPAAYAFMLPGGGVDSGFDSFDMGMGGGVGFDSVFGGDDASFRSSGGLREVYLCFSTAYSFARFLRVLGSVVALEVPVNQSEESRSVAFGGAYLPGLRPCRGRMKDSQSPTKFR